MANVVDFIEKQELIQKLVDGGHAKLVEALLYNEGAFTKRGRINKSGACRVLGWKTKQFEDALYECRKILGEDVMY